jgi:hypothetical protein
MYQHHTSKMYPMSESPLIHLRILSVQQKRRSTNDDLCGLYRAGAYLLEQVFAALCDGQTPAAQLFFVVKLLSVCKSVRLAGIMVASFGFAELASVNLSSGVDVNKDLC